MVNLRINRLLVITAALFLFSAACSSPDPKPVQNPKPATPNQFAILEQRLKELGWTGTLSYIPTPAANNTDTTFTLNVVDSGGKPLDGAQVRFSLLMPLMDMGRNEFTGAASGGGAYSGHGKFTMKGIWIVEVNVTKDNRRGRFEFEVHVKE